MGFFFLFRFFNMINLYGLKFLIIGLFGVLRRLGLVRCILIEIFLFIFIGFIYFALIFSNFWDNSGFLILGGVIVIVSMIFGVSVDGELLGDMFRNDLYRFFDDEVDLLNGFFKEMGKVEVFGRFKFNFIL